MECMELLACRCGTRLTSLAVEDGHLVCPDCETEMNCDEVYDAGICCSCLIGYAELHPLTLSDAGGYCPWCGIIILN